jgi:hypothetical protein
LDAATHLAAIRRDWKHCARWFGAAAAIRDRIGAPTEEYYAVLHEKAFARAATKLGAEAAATERSRGAALSSGAAMDELLAWVLLSKS